MTARTPKTRAAAPPAARGSASPSAGPAGALPPVHGAPAQPSGQAGSPTLPPGRACTSSGATPHPVRCDGTPEEVPSAPAGASADVSPPAGTSPSTEAPAAATGGGPEPGRGGAGPLRPGQGETQTRIAAAMSEDRGPDSLDAHVRRLCADLGLLRYHTHDARRSPAGFPDLVIVGTRVLYRELKTERGKVSEAQGDWLGALAMAGCDAGVWRPSHLLSGAIARELAAISGLRVAGGAA